MGIRKGSIVNIVTAQLNGPGSQNGSEAGAEVVEITDAYICVKTTGGSALVLPWQSVRSIAVTTF